MKAKIIIALSAREVAAVRFYAGSYRNTDDNPLFKIGEKIDANVRRLCDGNGLPLDWLDENEDGGFYTYISSL